MVCKCIFKNLATSLLNNVYTPIQFIDLIPLDERSEINLFFFIISIYIFLTRKKIKMKNTLTIYHNPRCSKSRQTLNIILDKNIKPKVHLYLDIALSKNQIEILLRQLNKTPKEIIRGKEEIYKKLSLEKATDDQIINAIIDNPILLERPIVTNGKKAIIGRPPENVLALL